jgi:hypothetical protein
VFFVWVSSNEQKWVTLAERRGQVLLDPFEQVMDMLPINMPPKLRSTIGSIPCM